MFLMHLYLISAGRQFFGIIVCANFVQYVISTAAHVISTAVSTDVYDDGTLQYTHLFSYEPEFTFLLVGFTSTKAESMRNNWQ